MALFGPLFLRIHTHTARRHALTGITVSAESKSILLDDFRNLIIKYKEQQQQIGALPGDKDVGIMKVDTRILKDTFAPSPVACMKQLETLLPQLAAKQQRSLLEEVFFSCWLFACVFFSRGGADFALHFPAQRVVKEE